ncbi:P-loop containing nucleoside triphosphate hydrolase protein [Pavlovales sp. CCMP2436]|nr:P-loop containing nucleoside triphosphate hydrolase protein [Pavlovales sp. CCMP2436]
MRSMWARQPLALFIAACAHAPHPLLATARAGVAVRRSRTLPSHARALASASSAQQPTAATRTSGPVSSLLDGLDADQRAAVLAPIDCVVRVSAGPGSGKTRVLTRRIQALNELHAVPLRKVLALSFTRKTAGEMRHRLSVLLGVGPAAELCASTFHQWCAQTLYFELGLSREEWAQLTSAHLKRLHRLSPEQPLPDSLVSLSRLQGTFEILDTNAGRNVIKDLVPEYRALLEIGPDSSDDGWKAMPSQLQELHDFSPVALQRCISMHKSTHVDGPPAVAPRPSRGGGGGNGTGTSPVY